MERHGALRAMLRHLGPILLIPLALAGCSDLGKSVRPEPKPELSSNSLDFGIVAVSGTATRTLTVRNAGSGVLTGSAAVSCSGYQLIDGSGPFSIAPGQSKAFVVRFSPGSLGSFPCALDLGPHAPQVPITGTSAIQEPGAISFIAPDSLDFGVAPLGQIKTGAFQVFSIGTAPLLVDIVSTSSDYVIVSGGGLTQIPVGGFVNVLVAFSPRGSLNRPGEINVGPGLPNVVLRGFGVTLSFHNDIQPIFAAKCDQACHTHLFHDPATAYQNLISSGYIIPFNEQSYLYYMIVNGLMPQGGPTLPQEELDTFRTWILEGARDN